MATVTLHNTCRLVSAVESCNSTYYTEVWQERVRSEQASCEEFYELGAVMLRKKFFYMANKYLEQAIAKWDADEQELAQVSGLCRGSFPASTNTSISYPNKGISHHSRVCLK